MKLHIYSLFFYLCIVSIFSYADQPQELRIVSLAPSNTAIIRDLGLGSALLGITKFCTKPDDATGAIVIGTMTHPNIELITTLKPTLVLGNVESNRVESLDKADAVGLPLVRLGPSQSLEEIIRDVETVAEMTHCQSTAKQIINRVTAHLSIIETILENQKRKSVFVEVWHKPLTTVSKLGFIHHVMQVAGADNIFAEAPVAYPKISLESVIAKKPEAVFILTHSLFSDDRVNKYREYPQLQNTIVHQTDASELSQPSLTAFIHAVEYFAAILHPGLDIPTMPPLGDNSE